MNASQHLGLLDIMVKVDTEQAEKSVEEFSEKLRQLRKLMPSLWDVIKLRMLGLHKRKSLVTIEELIAKDHEYDPMEAIR